MMKNRQTTLNTLRPPASAARHTREQQEAEQADADERDAIVQALSARYNEIGSRCRSCGESLASLADEIVAFHANAHALADWLAGAEREMRERFGEVPLQPEELMEQSEELTVSLY